MRRTFTVFAATSNVRTGGWCRDCLLPSGVTFDLVLISEQGAGPRRPVSRCGDCGGDRIEVDE